MISDTTPEAEKVQFEILRRLTGEERLEMAARLRRMSHDLLQAGLRDRFPKDSDQDVQRRLFRILLGDELFERVYGLR